MTNAKGLTIVCLVYAIYLSILYLDPGNGFGPASWGILSMSLWIIYIITRGWGNLGTWDKQQLVWAMISVLAFLYFLQHDPGFRGWGDVYFFCGSQLEYCTCDFRWNLSGWVKASILWNFVLTAALGAQKTIIQVGLNGLLPGEEVVTKESFISICWRLIPYWLNNWEQQWGAECSSMMFELPHFAVELLVILPCVQILCSRMKILAMPIVALPVGAEVQEGFVRENFAPNILKGFWEHHPERKRLLPRLKANTQLMMFAVAITSLAAFNALCVPLHLEHQISVHPSTISIQMAGKNLPWDKIFNASAAPSRELLTAHGIFDDHHQEVLMRRFSHFAPLSPHASIISSDAAVSSLSFPLEEDASDAATSSFAGSNFSGAYESIRADQGASATSATGDAAFVAPKTASKATLPDADAVSKGMDPYAAEGHATLQQPQQFFQQQQQLCMGYEKLSRNINKHANEIKKMQDVRHIELIPLVESALAVMRLSCEKYFVLISVFVSYLLFKEPPRMARLMIRLNSNLSTIFQKVILFSFPAVCWIYGAGFIFSTFVSVVFWGGPLLLLYNALRSNSSTVRVKALQAATPMDIERMGGNCAICWGDMVVPGSAARQPGRELSQDGLEAESGSSAAALSECGAARSLAGRPDAHDVAASEEEVEGAYLTAKLAPPQQQQQSLAPIGTHVPPPPPQLQPPVVAPTGAHASWQDQDAEFEDSALEGFSLPCSHAYHHACLHQWLHQCHAQGTTPKCPMCQAVIQLEVKWRFPYPWKKLIAEDLLDADGAFQEARGILAINPNNALNPNDLQMLGLLDHQREVQEMLRDMPQILPPEAVMVLHEEPAHQQVQQLQQERHQLLQERNGLVERRGLLQDHFEAERHELLRLHEQQNLARQQEQQLQELEGDLQRQPRDTESRGSEASHAAHEGVGEHLAVGGSASDKSLSAGMTASCSSPRDDRDGCPDLNEAPGGYVQARHLAPTSSSTLFHCSLATAGNSSSGTEAAEREVQTRAEVRTDFAPRGEIWVDAAVRPGLGHSARAGDLERIVLAVAEEPQAESMYPLSSGIVAQPGASLRSGRKSAGPSSPNVAKPGAEIGPFQEPEVRPELWTSEAAGGASRVRVLEQPTDGSGSQAGREAATHARQLGEERRRFFSFRGK